MMNEKKQQITHIINANALSLFQSSFASQLISNNNSSNYIFMNYYKRIPSRIIFDKHILKLNNHQIGNELLFYQYKLSHGICWFVMIIFRNSGGGFTVQCQCKQTENGSTPLNCMNDKLCIGSQMRNNKLHYEFMNGFFCTLIANNNGNNNYDMYGCDIN